MDEMTYQQREAAREAANAKANGNWVGTFNPSVGGVLLAWRGPYWTTPISGDELARAKARR